MIITIPHSNEKNAVYLGKKIYEVNKFRKSILKSFLFIGCERELINLNRYSKRNHWWREKIRKCLINNPKIALLDIHSDKNTNKPTFFNGDVDIICLTNYTPEEVFRMPFDENIFLNDFEKLVAKKLREKGVKIGFQLVFYIPTTDIYPDIIQEARELGHNSILLEVREKLDLVAEILSEVVL